MFFNFCAFLFMVRFVFFFFLSVQPYVTKINPVIRINQSNATLQQLITYCTLRWQFNYASARCDMTTTLSSIIVLFIVSVYFLIEVIPSLFREYLVFYVLKTKL